MRVRDILVLLFLMPFMAFSTKRTEAGIARFVIACWAIVILLLIGAGSVGTWLIHHIH